MPNFGRNKPSVVLRISSLLLIVCSWRLDRSLLAQAFSISSSLCSPSTFVRDVVSRRAFGTNILIASAGFGKSKASEQSTTTSDNNSTKKMIRWGIIGLGDVTQTKSGPAFYKSNGSELVAVMRRTPGKAMEWVEQRQEEIATYQDSPCVAYESLESFLQHPNLNAIYISTRPGSHLELCRQILDVLDQTSLKAIYVEKPVGRCVAETQAMATLLSSHKIAFYTAYMSRAYERTLAVRDLLQQGVLGDHVSAINYQLVGTGGARGLLDSSIPWRLDAEQSGGGLIMDVGCHIIDRIDWICGPIINVQGEATSNPQQASIMVEDYVSFQGTIDGCDWASIKSTGATVKCSWDFNPQGVSPCDELTIHGPKGKLQMVGMSPNAPIQIFDTNHQLIRQIDFPIPQHTAQPMVQAITDELNGLGSAPFLSRADNAMRTETILDSILSSYYGGREIGYWTRPETWPGRKSK